MDRGDGAALSAITDEMRKEVEALDIKAGFGESLSSGKISILAAKLEAWANRLDDIERYRVNAAVLPLRPRPQLVALAPCDVEAAE